MQYGRLSDCVKDDSMDRKTPRRNLMPLAFSLALFAGPAVGAGSAAWAGAVSEVPGSQGPALLSGPLKALKVATLDLPRPIGTGLVALPGSPDAEAPAQQAKTETVVALLATEDADGTLGIAPDTDGAPLIFGPEPVPVYDQSALLVVALDTLLEVPFLADADVELTPGASFGPDIAAINAIPLSAFDRDAPLMTAPESAVTTPVALSGPTAAKPLYQDPVAVFGSTPQLFPPLAFEYPALADQGIVPLPSERPAFDGVLAAASADATPAQRLGLAGTERAQAEKCLAEAVYFESRGEPKRGQIAVAQVVINRVFSGYYPHDVCKAVYQNANRHLACQFTFACDNVKEVIREPDMWVQAKEIASDMLDGKLWLDSVGAATHYHAYWVHPRWVREMRKLDRIGVHTFYRPRAWQS